MEGENRCVFCGEIIPEGLQVCYACMSSIDDYAEIGEETEAKAQEKKK